jgi:hypothetical protein
MTPLSTVITVHRIGNDKMTRLGQRRSTVPYLQSRWHLDLGVNTGQTHKIPGSQIGGRVKWARRVPNRKRSAAQPLAGVTVLK